MSPPKPDRIAALEARLAALEEQLAGGEVTVRKLVLADAQGRVRGVLAVDDEMFGPFEPLQSDPVDVAALILLDRAGAARLALHVGRGGTAGVAIMTAAGTRKLVAQEIAPLLPDAARDRAAAETAASADARARRKADREATAALFADRRRRQNEAWDAKVEADRAEVDGRQQRRRDAIASRRGQIKQPGQS